MIDKRQEHNSKLRILQFGHLYDRCVRRCPIPPFQRLEHVRQVRAERIVLLRAHVHLSARWAGPGICVYAFKAKPRQRTSFTQECAEPSIPRPLPRS
jgi:hypothetical protein